MSGFRSSPCESQQVGSIRCHIECGAKRSDHFTGYELCDDHEITLELDKYTFGNARTLQDFEEFTGIDFKKKTVSKKSTHGLFIEELRRRLEAGQQQASAAVAAPPSNEGSARPATGGTAPSNQLRH